MSSLSYGHFGLPERARASQIRAGLGAFLLALAGAATVWLSVLYVNRGAIASGPSSNRLFSYQVSLSDANGIALTGTQNVILNFYTVSTGGTPIHTDCGTVGTPVARKAVMDNGTASIVIGDAGADASHDCVDSSAPNVVPANLFSNTSLYLGVTIGADAEMTPRKRIVSTGYAANADLLDDFDTSAVGGSIAFVPVTDSGGNLTLTQNLTVDAGTLFIDATNDNVGIGTVTPAVTLHTVVQQPSATNGPNANSYSAARFMVQTSGGGPERGIELGAPTSAISDAPVYVKVQGSSNRFGILNEDNAERLTISSFGNVGIGNTAPAARLDVVGGMRVTGRTAELSGDIDPAASTTVTGVNTRFTEELVAGDRVTVSGETRIVVAIASNTSLTVDTAFSDNLNDATPDAVYALATIRDSSNAMKLIVNDLGNVGIGDSTPASLFTVGSGDMFRVDSSGNVTTLGDVTIEGGDLITTQTTFNLVAGASTVNIAGGSGSTGCTVDVSGNLTCSGTVTGGGGAAFVNGGNSFGGAATLGTNDAFGLSFETSGVSRLTIDSAGAASMTSSLDVAGSIAVGPDATVESGTLILAQRFSAVGSGSVYGIRSHIENEAPGALATGHFYGAFTSAVTSSSDIATYSGGSLNGLAAEAYHQGSGTFSGGTKALSLYATSYGTGTGTGGTVTGISLYALNEGSLTVAKTEGIEANFGITGSGNVTNATGIDFWPDFSGGGDLTGSSKTININNPGVSGGSTIAANYGIYIDSQTAGAINYALYSAGGQSYHAGNFGIGDATPASLLTVGSGDMFRVDSSGNVTTLGDVTIEGGDLVTTQTTFNLVAGASTVNIAGGSGSTGCTVDSSGNLACSGTVSGGGGEVYINGGNSFGGIARLGTNDAFDLEIETSGTARITVASGGNVGIGFVPSGSHEFSVYSGTQKAARFEMAQTSTNTMEPFFELFRSVGSGSGANGVGGSIDIALENSADSSDYAGRIGLEYTNATSGAETSAMTLWTRNAGGAMAERVRVDGAGNVGIGDATPSSLLTVGSGDQFRVDGSGNIVTNGDITVEGGDFITTQATFNLLAGATTVNIAGGSGSTGCTVDGSGNLSCSGAVTGGGTGFVNNGNSFAGAATLGTNDAFALNFETNNITYLTIASGGGFTLPVDTDWTLTGGTNGLSFDGTTFSVDAANNRIGIGTASPRMALEIFSAGDVAWNLHKSSVAENTWGVSGPFGTSISLFNTNADKYEFRTGQDGTAFPGSGDARLTILATNGNVGVGDATPSALLTVGSGDAFKVDLNGDVTGSIVTLDGTDLANGSGSSATTLILDDTTDFNAGNYVFVNSAYAKIVSVDSGTNLTISPALTWADNAAVTEVHIPEIGGTNTASTLANRFGRGYFIDGVVTGNGTTYLTDRRLKVAPSTSGDGHHFSILGSDAGGVGGMGGDINIVPGAGNGGPAPGSVRIGYNTGTTDQLIVSGSAVFTVLGPTTGKAFTVNAGATSAFEIHWDNTNSYREYRLSSSNQARFTNATSYTFSNKVGVLTNSPLTALDVSGNFRTTGKATAVLSGSIDPAASTTVTGVGTLFTTELVVGDRITVSGETRTVVAIATATSLTVHAAFTDNANDTTPDVLYALVSSRTSAGNTINVTNNLGNVGVGVVAPSVALDVSGTATTDFIQNITNTDTANTADGLSIKLGPATNPGTGNSFVSFKDGSGSVVGQIQGDGAGNITYTTTSDSRLKENVVPYDGALATVNAMQVKTYNMVTAPGKPQYGFIAQELFTVIPQVVSVGGDDPKSEPWTVDYGRITPVLARAIQELDAKLVALSELDAESTAALGAFSSPLIEAEKVTADVFAVRRTDDRKTIGNATLPSGETFTQVHDASILPGSKVFFSFRKNPGSYGWIEEVGEGFFVLKVAQPTVEEVHFDYWIIDVVDETTPVVEPEPVPEPVEEPEPEPETEPVSEPTPEE